jgi:hypothetical protein
MPFGQRGAAAAVNGRNDYQPAYTAETAYTQKAPFGFAAVALSALVAATTFFLLVVTYLLVFAIHTIGPQAAYSTVMRALIIGVPLSGSLYLVSLLMGRSIIRRFAGSNVAIYALVGAICSSILVTLFQLLTIRNGNFIVLVVIAPGGLAGGLLLGALERKRQSRPS